MTNGRLIVDKIQNFHCVLDFVLEKLGKAELALKEAQYEALGCKVQLHVPVVHPGQRPKVGDRQPGRSTGGGKLISSGPLR